MTKHVMARFTVVATLILSASGCSYLRMGKSESAEHPAPQPPSDANIAAILLAANNTDVSYARLVPSRAQSQAVKEFGERMLADHTHVNQLVTDLLTKDNLTPEDNSTSLDLRDESSAKRDILRELQGRAFDSTYIANEVSYHVKLLGAIDTVLLPSARNPDIKQLITAIRPAVAGHLAHARQIESKMMAGAR